MKRGFPRPTIRLGNNFRTRSWGPKWSNRTYPIPYSASIHNIAVLDDDRAHECMLNKLCSVCGLGIEEDFIHLIIDTEATVYTDLIMNDSGPLHQKCAIMAFTLCPQLAIRPRYQHAVASWTEVQYLFEKVAGNS